MWISSWAFRLGYFQIIHFFKYYRCTWKMNWNSRRYDNNRFDSFFTLKMFIFIVSCWTEPSGSDYISWRFCRFGVSCLFCCTEYFHKNQSTVRLFGRRNCINFHQIRYMLRKMKSYICDFEIVSNNLIKSFFFLFCSFFGHIQLLWNLSGNSCIRLHSNMAACAASTHICRIFTDRTVIALNYLWDKLVQMVFFYIHSRFATGNKSEYSENNIGITVFGLTIQFGFWFRLLTFHVPPRKFCIFNWSDCWLDSRCNTKLCDFL